MHLGRMHLGPHPPSQVGDVPAATFEGRWRLMQHRGLEHVVVVVAMAEATSAAAPEQGLEQAPEQAPEQIVACGTLMLEPTGGALTYVLAYIDECTHARAYRWRPYLCTCIH